MSLRGETVWFDVEEVAQTSLAYLFKFKGVIEEIWIPKSQCGGRRKKDGKVERIELSAWIVKEKELERPSTK